MSPVTRGSSLVSPTLSTFVRRSRALNFQSTTKLGIEISRTLDTIMSRYVAGTKMEHGEVVYVPAPVPEAPHGTCVWCGEPFEDGDMRCIAMLTEVEDGSWDWLSGEYIHGECDYERDDKTKEEMKND